MVHRENIESDSEDEEEEKRTRNLQVIDFLLVSLNYSFLCKDSVDFPCFIFPTFYNFSKGAFLIQIFEVLGPSMSVKSFCTNILSLSLLFLPQAIPLNHAE